jgi:hypothetical protein
LSTVNLSEAIYNGQTKWPKGFRADAHEAILVQKPL